MLKVQTGQIIEFYSNSCSVVSDGKNYKCKILGRINLVVGDLVKFERVNDGGKYQGIVTKRNDRLTVLHKSKENIKKPIAANISNIGILVSKNPRTNLEFIDKWIAISINASIEPFIVFNKIDAVADNEFLNTKNLYEAIEVPTFSISAKFRTNIESLKKYLANKTTILVGNSGSGKSTLTTAITGKEILSRELSNNQGVHTTSVSTLYNSDNIKLIDSPGVRDIGIEHLVQADIISAFSEINNLAANCAYPKCAHKNDEGCAVMNGVQNGDIEESRYNNFIFLSQDNNA